MEPPSSRNVTVLNESGRRIRSAQLRDAASIALARHGHAGEAVCVLLTGDRQIRELNRTYRGVDETTDVLSFPSGDFPADDVERTLGDVAISVEYADRQAAARGVSLTQELAFLTIHGALHLVGLDDETEPERARVVREMNEVAVEAGLKPDLDWASLLHGGPSEPQASAGES